MWAVFSMPSVVFAQCVCMVLRACHCAGCILHAICSLYVQCVCKVLRACHCAGCILHVICSLCTVCMYGVESLSLCGLYPPCHLVFEPVIIVVLYLENIFYVWLLERANLKQSQKTKSESSTVEHKLINHGDHELI